LPVQIYKERKNLAYTLQDARGVVSKLELIMGVMMHVLFVFFYLIIFDVSCTLLWKLLCNQVNLTYPMHWRHCRAVKLHAAGLL